MAAVPSLNSKGKELYTIPGIVPTVKNFEKGCRFSPRCEESSEACKGIKPELTRVGDNHFVECWKYNNSEGSPCQK